MALDSVILTIIAERARQDAKWGEQNHDDLYWLGILMEELGETAKALIESDNTKAREELIHTVAVGIGWLECIERRSNNGVQPTAAPDGARR